MDVKIIVVNVTNTASTDIENKDITLACGRSFF
jgi:hypothetical protein